MRGNFVRSHGGTVMGEHVCCLDMGTTSVKAAVVDRSGRIAGLASSAHLHVGGAGAGAEFDAVEHIREATGLVSAALSQAGISGRDVAAVSVTNQRASVVPLGRDLEPCGSGISWQDTRCGEAIARLGSRLAPERFTRITGLPQGFLWTLGKLLWLRSARPDEWARTARVALVHDLVLRALGTEDIVTDVSNGSLTGMLDLRAGRWSREILEAAELEEEMLPRLVRPGEVVGHVSAEAARTTGLTEGTPLVAGGGDQQCATLGIGVMEPGDAGLCLGTAAVVSCPVPVPLPDPSGRYFCTAHAFPGRYVLEGIHNAFGASLSWAAQALGFDSLEALENAAAASPAGAGGVLFLPWLAGIGTPDFDAGARGVFTGVSMATGRSDLARAVYEGIALETGRILEAFEASPVPLRRIILSGGGSSRSLIGRVLADVTGRELLLSRATQASLVGAAALAWTGAGAFPDVGAATQSLSGSTEAVLSPVLEAGERESLRERYGGWVQSVRGR